MLHINDLAVSFNQTPILSSISLQLTPGTLSFLLGPNGSGKSTLFNAILGHPLYTIDRGSIYFDNQDITNISTEKRASQGIFLATQHAPILNGVSVISFLQAMYRSLVSDISITELRILVEQYAEQVGLDTSCLSRSVNDGFSGGEKKRFELLQLLLIKPRLALLDEIDSGLDADGQQQFVSILQHIMRANKHMTVLCITHSLAIAEQISAETVFVLKQGALIKQGDASLLKKIKVQGYDGLLL